MTIIRSFEYSIKDRDVWYVRFQVDPENKYLVIGREGATSKAASDLYFYLINTPRGESEEMAPTHVIPSHLHGLLRDVSFSPDSKYMVASSDSGHLALFVANKANPKNIQSTEEESKK